MNKLLIPIAAAAICITSCKDTEYKRINSDQLRMIEDSVAHLIPDVRTIHTLQNDDDDLTKVKIIIGDVTFYAASADAKRAAADRLGLAILRVMGKDNNLKKGIIVFTRNVKDDKENLADAINIEIDLAAMQKTAFPGQ